MKDAAAQPEVTGHRDPPRRAVAIKGAPGAKFVQGGRGAVADAMLALAAAKGVEVRRDADLAEVLSAMDASTVSSDAAAALTAAVLDRLYRINDAAKTGGGSTKT